MRTRKNWIKSLGDEERKIPDHWGSHEGGLLRRSVPFPQQPNMQPGDRIVMYANRTGLVFAAAEATSYPYEHDSSDRPWRVDVKIIAAVENIRHGAPLDALAVDGREHNVRIRRRSHVNLTDAEFEAAVGALSERSYRDA